MAAAIIDGKHIAETIRQELAEEITQLQAEHHLTPGLAVVLVGDNPIRIKRRIASRRDEWMSPSAVPPGLHDDQALPCLYSRLSLRDSEL